MKCPTCKTLLAESDVLNAAYEMMGKRLDAGKRTSSLWRKLGFRLASTRRTIKQAEASRINGAKSNGRPVERKGE